MPSNDFRPGIVKMNDRPYQIDLESWQGRDIVDFAPRASVPGGAIVHSQLGLYQPFVQTDWRHGFGFHWYSDEGAYMHTDGYIDTRQPGIAMLFTKPEPKTVVATASAQIYGFTSWNNAAWAWGTGGLYKYSSGSWSNVYSASDVLAVFPTGTYLFYSPKAARVRKVDTSDTHSDTGVGAASLGYRWFTMHKGYIYAGQSSNVVYYAGEETLGDLEGAVADDTNEIYVGFSGMTTLGAISFAGRLHIAKADGLFQLGEDNQTAIKVLDFSDQISTDNFRFLVVHNGKLVFPIRDVLYEWNGTRLVPSTPPKVTDTFPYATYGQFDNAVAVGRFLYLTALTNESTPEQHLLCYDGVGWHKLADLITTSGYSVSGMGYDAVNNYLWYHIHKKASPPAASASSYIQFQDQSEFPYASFPVGGTNSLVTSRLAMGFRWVDKTLSTMFLETANCDSGTYINVYYRRDTDTSWVLWDAVKTNGIVRLTEPGGGDSIEFKHIQFRFDFITDDAAQSPILEGYTTRFLIRPDVSYGYVFDVIMRSQAQIGPHTDQRSSFEVKADLREARQSKSPIELVTPYGEKIIGFVSALNEHLIEEHPRAAGGHPDIEGLVRVNFAETDQH